MLLITLRLARYLMTVRTYVCVPFVEGILVLLALLSAAGSSVGLVLNPVHVGVCCSVEV